MYLRLNERILRQYAGQSYRDLLRNMLWENHILLTGYLDWYNRPVDVVNEFHAGAAVMHRYGIMLTVGDVSALQADFEGHAALLWDRMQTKGA